MPWEVPNVRDDARPEARSAFQRRCRSRAQGSFGHLIQGTRDIQQIIGELCRAIGKHIHVRIQQIASRKKGFFDNTCEERVDVVCQVIPLHLKRLKRWHPFHQNLVLFHERDQVAKRRGFHVICNTATGEKLLQPSFETPCCENRATQLMTKVGILDEETKEFFATDWDAFTHEP